MKVHHLNCATMCPYGARLIHGTGSLFAQARMVCHCLLIETPEGLILVDTGLGMGDLAHPQRLGNFFLKMVRPRLDPEETALQQVIRLGFKPEDVRDIVLTHLDVDHAGGLADFPQARVHILGGEYEAAMHPQTFVERHRYIQEQWAHELKWVHHAVAGEKWFGFENVRAIHSNLTEILLIPLFGHTRGHCGVAIKREQGWLLHGGDAYFFHGEMNVDHPHCPIGLNLFQRFMQVDREARLSNQDRLRDLLRNHGKEVELFSAHDPVEFARY